MTLKTRTSRRGMIVTSAVAVAAVLVALGATAMMNDDDKPAGGTAVEQSSPQDGASAANAEPKFLETSELPASAEAKAWTDQGTKPGLPEVEYTCIKGQLPAGSTTYKFWSGDMTAEMREFVTAFPDAAAAEAAVASIGTSLADCGDAVEEDSSFDRIAQYPDVANGLTIYGMYFAPEGSEYHLQLFGVGRDGSNVVVTALGQGGKEEDAPIDAFTASSKTALDKAF